MPLRTSYLLCLLVCCAGGCIQVELVLQLNEDGSGTVTERVTFLEKLVNVAGRLRDVPSIDDLTSDTRVNQRVAKMGTGVSLTSKKVEKRPDGTIQMTCTYNFDDVSALRLAPIPFGVGWEDVALAFTLDAETDLTNRYNLRIRMTNFDRRRPDRPARPPPTEVEAQDIRRLLPIFKDMIEGFDLRLRLEVYRYDQWATATRGHPGTGGGTDVGNELPMAGGRTDVFHITGRNITTRDDGMLLVVPWRQVGRELDLYYHRWPPGPQIMPYMNQIHPGGQFMYSWRAIQKAHGREFY